MLDFTLMKTMVRDVARSVSSNFPTYVTPEDTEGALWVYIYEKKTQLEAAVRDDPQNWERKIAGTMRKVAFDHCAREKAAVEGYSVDDLYRYSLPKIRALMEDVFSYTDWQSFGLHGDGQPSAKRQVNEGNDRVAELVDVRRAVERLPHDTKELLYYQYAMHYTSENLGNHFGISEEAAKKRSQRALGAVQKLLGRAPTKDEPKPFERRAVRSNASWRAQQSSQWDG
jgi:DNA-directed RNA polymerase specialized sigma24 family protein